MSTLKYVFHLWSFKIRFPPLKWALFIFFPPLKWAQQASRALSPGFLHGGVPRQREEGRSSWFPCTPDNDRSHKSGISAQKFHTESALLLSGPTPSHHRGSGQKECPQMAFCPLLLQICRLLSQIQSRILIPHQSRILIRLPHLISLPFYYLPRFPIWFVHFSLYHSESLGLLFWQAQ